MQIYDESESNGAQLFFSKKQDGDGVGKFYVTGEDNDRLFREEGKLNAQQKAPRRRLGFYKFKCLENEPVFNINIGIVVDKSFCRDNADRGTANCENAAMAIVNETSMLMKKQLNVQLQMKDFMEVDWPCNAVGRGQ